MTPPRIVPPREGNDAKEVFAFFGLAAYHGQVLEQELVIFAVMLNLSGRSRVTREAFEALFDRLEVWTFGQLFREARSLTPIPRGLETKLNEALARRNDLAHRFFARHSEDFMSEAGRIGMIEELRATTGIFEDVDAAVTAVRVPLSSAIGITEEMAKHELDEMLARAAARDKGV